MNILIINCGSSSVKYQLIEIETRQALAKGIVDRIGMNGAVLTNLRSDGDEIKITGEILDHTAAIEYILAVLLSKNHGVLTDKSQINAVGHRVVHGGEAFSASVLITDDVIKRIRDNIDIAPLHNPHNLRGINACQVPFARYTAGRSLRYGIPSKNAAARVSLRHPVFLYTQHKIRRYGFHWNEPFIRRSTDGRVNARRL